MESVSLDATLGADDAFMAMYPVGEVVDYHLTAWVIILSYVTSLIGAEATVELLHRRRVARDWYSRLHLGLCAVCFGLVAIWCMHFVGNKSIVMGNGDTRIQLYYSAGWTTLSAILPVFVLYGAFFLTEMISKSQRAMYFALVATGLLAGMAVTGMHYIGNLGTSNYVLEHSTQYVMGAAAIAIVACWFSFTLFFHQKEHWINYWWRRFLCAVLLAAAVSGMHWTATLGTRYQLKSYHIGNSNERNINVILAAVLCMLALVACVGIFYWSNIQRKKVAEKAQQVVLAAFIKDPSGRVLVTPEGLLPSEKITRQFNQRSFGDDLNLAHPVFQWMYRVSRNWPGITDLVPAMKAHLQALGMMKNSRPGTSAPTTPYEETDDEDYTMLFRAQFCIAAEELAEQLGMPLKKLGHLHDQMMMTGTTTIDLTSRSVKSADASEDIETGHIAPVWGKGQVLFVVRDVDEDESQRLVNSGFRFVALGNVPGKAPSKVVDIMAQSMQVKRSDLLTTIGSLRRMSIAPSDDSIDIKYGGELKSSLEANVHYIGVFALRAGFKSSGCRWEVLVHRDGHSMIPCYPICEDSPAVYEQLSAVEVTAREAKSYYQTHLANSDSSRRSYFVSLLEAIDVFTTQIPRAVMDNAIFSGVPIRVPVGKNTHGSPTYATIWAFTVIPDVHNTNLVGKSADLWDWIPFNFFQCLQRVSDSSPDHAILARKNHIEFAQLFSRTLKEPMVTTVIGNKQTFSGHVHNKFSLVRHWRNSVIAHEGENNMPSPDNSSEKALVRSNTRDRDASTHKETGGGAFGGIMVSQDIVVDSGVKIGGNIELQDFGVRSHAGVAMDEQPTWVDRLYGLLSNKWSKLAMRDVQGRI